MEARHIQTELERLLERRVFLDSDDLTDLRLLLDAVRESDCLLLLQSARLLSRPWCLLEINAAIEAGVPIVAINVQGGAPYSFEEAHELMKTLDTRLDIVNPGAGRMLRDHGIDLVDLAHQLSSVRAHTCSVIVTRTF